MCDAVKSELDQNEKPPFSSLCQLPPAADIHGKKPARTDPIGSAYLLRGRGVLSLVSPHWRGVGMRGSSLDGGNCCRSTTALWRGRS